MRKLLLALAIALPFWTAPAVAQDVNVKGYHRSDGTYVQPHKRSRPDGNPFNNFSTRGNVNPYTGKPGTVDPYRSRRSGSSLLGGGNRRGKSLLGQ